MSDARAGNRSAPSAQLAQFDWWREVQELMAEGWDWRKAVYMAWAASPVRARKPATQAELAVNVLGLRSDRTIRRWRESEPAMRERIAALQAAPLLKHRRDIYDALVEAAVDPDPKNHQDRKLALELLGDYQSRSKSDVALGGTVAVGMLKLEEWTALAAQRRADAEATLAVFDDAPDDEGGD